MKGHVKIILQNVERYLFIGFTLIVCVVLYTENELFEHQMQDWRHTHGEITNA